MITWKPKISSQPPSLALVSSPLGISPASGVQVTGPEEERGGAGETGRRLVGKPRPHKMNKIWKIKQTQPL